MDETKLREIATAWSGATNVVIFTGAGMSTESGLPDFRSQQGLWRQRPESLATVEALRTQPDEAYFFYQWRIARFWDVQPNAGHLALAEMEKTNRVVKIITQNVDGLHQRAGSLKVTEIHGTLRTVSCMKCREVFENRQLLPKNTSWEDDHKTGKYQHGKECYCPRCEGALRPDVILFGEALPTEAWDDAMHWSRKADFFVVIGSSLQVSPANYLPEVAAKKGAKLLIINNEPTPLDSLAAWLVRKKAAETLAVLKKYIINEE